MLAVAVTPGAGFSFGTPQNLFSVNIQAGQGSGIAVTDNGQRLVGGGRWAVIVGERAASTLRKLYATPWNPWTPVETLDKKQGNELRKLESPPSDIR